MEREKKERERAKETQSHLSFYDNLLPDYIDIKLFIVLIRRQERCIAYRYVWQQFGRALYLCVLGEPRPISRKHIQTISSK